MMALISRLFLNAQVTWYAVLQVLTLHWIHEPFLSLHRTHTRDQRDGCEREYVRFRYKTCHKAQGSYEGRISMTMI